MVSTTYSLLIDDEVAGPSLELLRLILQPESHSLPHVTVRYVRGQVSSDATRLYDEYRAERITLLRAGTFDRSNAEAISTLFIQCEAVTLEYLHHKPDFPDSFFHVSLYDGPPSQVAYHALRLLRSYAWNLDVYLDHSRLTSSRPKREPGSGRSRLSSSAAVLLKTLTSGRTSSEDVVGLDAEARLALIAQVAEHMNIELPRADPITETYSGTRNLARVPRYKQEEFWPASQFIDGPPGRLTVEPDFEEQRRAGVFLTPPELAYDISSAALALLQGPLDFGDPAVGSGVFLASVVNLVGREAVDSAIGVETDSVRGQLTFDRWTPIGLDVVVGDFVDQMCRDVRSLSDREQVDDNRWRLDLRTLILANPPYIRSQMLDTDQTDRWRSWLSRKRGITLSARADLYVYFVLAAHDWLADNGIGAWLLPTEFMFTQYGHALREYLTTNVRLIKIHTYDGPSRFSNARVTSCAVIFRKSSDVGDSQPAVFSAGGSIDEPFVSSLVELDELRATQKWHFLADDGTRTKVATEPVGYRLGDLFDVRRGIATGSNRHFVVSSQLAASFAGASPWLFPVLPRSRELHGQVIEARPDGTRDPNIPGVRWLIDADASLAEIERTSPELAEYLRSIRSEVMRSTIVSRRRIFYKQERHAPPRFIFTYMSRDENFSSRFFLNRSRALVLNNFLALYPKPLMQKWLDRASENEERALSVLRGLDSATLARAGRVYVEGLTKVEPGELKDIRLYGLPDFLTSDTP